jgi:molybdopterin-guanine dinucleotide biosynthesis protein A
MVSTRDNVRPMATALRSLSMESIEAFILAGGASRRMGTDKSRLLLDGQTFTQRIANTLLEVACEVTIVGQRFEDSQVKSTSDVYPQWGALGGVHAALAAARTEWALVVACDLPFVTAGLFTRLAAFRNNHEAVVPIQKDGRPQPLCSLYRIDPSLGRAQELIIAGKRRPLDLLESVKTCWLPFADLQDLEEAEKFFLNINTPEDYYEATRKGTVPQN